MDSGPDNHKPYTVYRSSGDAPLPDAGPPRSFDDDRGYRREHARRRGGRGWLVLLVIVVLLVVAAAGAAYAGGWGPFAGDGGAAEGKATPAAAAAAGSSPAASPSVSPSPKPTVKAEPEAFTVTAGGDVIGGFGVSSVVGSMGSGLFRSIAPSFEASDFGFVNLESPLTSGGDAQGWKDVVIKGNPALAPAMAKSGINVVTMANNHAGDMGDSGLLDSIKYCEKNHIAVVGAGANLKEAQAGVVLKATRGKAGKTGKVGAGAASPSAEASPNAAASPDAAATATPGAAATPAPKPAKVAFLGFSDVLPAGYPATSTSPGTSPGRANLNAVKKAIRAAAKKSDYVVVGWHWNFEYKRAPSYLESSEGKAAIDAGADVVIAHHPHLLDGVQAYHGGLICYSLGNLVFSGFSGETAQTVLVKARVSKHAIDAQLIPVITNGSGIPSLAGGSTGASILQRMKTFSAALGTTVIIKGGRGYVHVKRGTKKV